MSRFRDYLVSFSKQNKAIGLSDKAFAQLIGVSYTTLRSYLDGTSEPSVDKAETILNAIGGDIERAFPEYSPPTSDDAPMRAHGELSTGPVIISAHPTEVAEVLENTFMSSRDWGLTEGEIVLLRVSDHSMAPYYRKGSLVAFRKPKDPDKILNGSDCIFTDRLGGKIFRRLARLSVGLIGFSLHYDSPSNEEHMWKKDEVEISLIAIGAITAANYEADFYKNKILSSRKHLEP